ncbi:MAG: sporulation protein YabP [Erysipelotrichaceae bacterium]
MSENSSSNPLNFVSNPYHNIMLKDRKYLEISGIKQIDSFDSNQFLVESVQGWMLIQGKELMLGKMDNESGIVIIKGLIDSISYVMNKKGNREPLFSKLFK